MENTIHFTHFFVYKNFVRGFTRFWQPYVARFGAYAHRFSDGVALE